MEGPGGLLGGLADDQLGTVAVALVISELRWTPDVAPAVMDRISRDAVAYPEQFYRRSAAPQEAPALPPSERSLARSLGRLAVLVVIIVLVAALVLVATTANAAACRGDDVADMARVLAAFGGLA